MQKGHPNCNDTCNKQVFIFKNAFCINHSLSFPIHTANCTREGTLADPHTNKQLIVNVSISIPKEIIKKNKTKKHVFCDLLVRQFWLTGTKLRFDRKSAIFGTL
jgi:hypothetical protein